jgi:hypothetical protein
LPRVAQRSRLSARADESAVVRVHPASVWAPRMVSPDGEITSLGAVHSAEVGTHLPRHYPLDLLGNWNRQAVDLVLRQVICRDRDR